MLLLELWLFWRGWEAVNGRSCEQSKLKYLSLHLAFGSFYPVLCSGPPVTYQSGPLIQKDNQHDLCTGNF